MQIGLTPCTVGVEVTIPTNQKRKCLNRKDFRVLPKLFAIQTLPVRHRMELAVKTAIT